ncbi:SpoIIE family protein phosphatase [Acidothermaceae bacterium B102]|nr:SpoIIE family protein phosphatase [Acidothermaceae bacterium B102]
MIGQAALDDAMVVRDRAVHATSLSFTVADARLPDQPLVWVNQAFTTTTGYSFAESVGRNCRFLQGALPDVAGAAEIRVALAEMREVSVTLLNYRKDGTSFWNAVTITPVYDDGGELTHFVGVQTDVTHHVNADGDRDRALVAERHAVRRSELAHAQLSLLAAASSQLALSFDVDDSLRRLAALVVPAFADWVVIHQVDSAGEVSANAIVRDRDGRVDLTDRYAELLPASLTAHAPLYALAGGARSWLAAEFDPDQALEWSTGSELAHLREMLGVASTLFVSLPGRQGTVGTMVLHRGQSSPRFTPDDLQVAIDLGRRAGLTVDNARLYQNEHRVAETLQRSLLPVLPQISGLDISARYRAAESGIEVGGDFYDVFQLPDGAVAVLIGDIVGHDLFAAAAMGHLRGLIRATAWDAAGDAREPAAVLHRADAVVQGLQVVPLATLAYARLEPASPDEHMVLRHATAGHPPMVVRDRDGSARLVRAEPGLLLGVQPTERITAHDSLGPGATLVAFTDGLVERRGEDIDVGLVRLRSLVELAPLGLTADQLCEHILDHFLEREDDSALMAVRRV